VQKRNATTTTASTMKSKASEGLTKVTSSAGETVSKATGAVSDAASNATGRTGKIIHAVQCMKLGNNCIDKINQTKTNAIAAMIPPIVYYSKVALEVGKIIVRGQKMSPP